MTLKDRILGWFNKDNKCCDEPCCQDYTPFEDEPDVSTLEPFEVEAIKLSNELVDKEAIEGTKEYNLEDMIAEFEIDVPGKKAIWGGKETKAFVKWKEDNNL